MARYRKIDTRIWNDEKFRAFSDDGQLAFFFILTHPSMTALGAMRATLPGLAAEKGWPVGRFADAIRDAIGDGSREGMLEVNEKACFIAARNFLKYNQPEGPNSVSKAWVEALDLVPECPEKRQLIGRCRSYLDKCSKKFRDAMPHAIWDAFPDAMVDGMSDASPIQEQEQEQEQEHIPPTPQGGNGTARSKTSQKKLSGNGDGHDGFNATEVARALCVANGWSGKELIWALRDAVEFQSKRMPEATLEQVGEQLVNAYRTHQATKGTYAVGPLKFFQEGKYTGAQTAGHKPVGKTAVEKFEESVRC